MELALANELFRQNSKKLEVSLVLDGLKVTVHLEVEDMYSMWIISDDTSDTLYSVEEEEAIVTPEAFANAIKKMRDTLDELYYYKPLGKFIGKDHLTILKFKVFKKFFQTEDCAICFEETSVHTHCNHYCCHKCMEQIKLCPICRRDLYE
jgi:hypothetical protein